MLIYNFGENWEEKNSQFLSTFPILRAAVYRKDETGARRYTYIDSVVRQVTRISLWQFLFGCQGFRLSSPQHGIA